MWLFFLLMFSTIHLIAKISESARLILEDELINHGAAFMSIWTPYNIWIMELFNLNSYT